MKAAIILPVLLLFCFISGCQTHSTKPEENKAVGSLEDTPSLKSLASFNIGMAVQARQFDTHPESDKYLTILNQSFNQVTAEYEMKMHPIVANSLSNGQLVFNWDAPDRIANYARENNLKIHGHALVWHNEYATPDFLENWSGSDEEFTQLVLQWVAEMVTRYKDVVASWDVANEAFRDGCTRADDCYRDSVFYKHMGPDYIATVFQAAHDSDPEALLFYNDYGLTYDNIKRKAAMNMVDDLVGRGISIDGVGLQMHIDINFPSKSQIKKAMDDIAKRDLLVHVSELDVRANPETRQNFTFTKSHANKQKQRVYDVVKTFRNLPKANQFAITVWGFRDADSWLNSFWQSPQYGLLFDNQFNPKPAYDGFVESLK